MMTIEQIREQVEKTFRDEADFDDTMELLAAHSVANPGDAELLRMRIALFDAAYDHVAAWKDRKTLLALQPEDLDNQLAMLSRQHRSAHWIADDAFAERMQALSPDDDSDGSDDEGDSDEGEEIEPADPEREAALTALQEEADAYADVLQNEAIDGFLQMMAVHAPDASSASKILAAWADTSIWNPWQHYTLILQALAAHPHEVALKKETARLLVSLCDTSEEDSVKTPIGYFEHMIAGRYHAASVYHAIAAIDEVDDLDTDPVLLTSKAQLLKTLDDYPAAASCLRQAGIAYAAALQSADQEQREDLQSNLSEVLRDAAACEGGREAVHAAHFAELDSSMARLDDLPNTFMGKDDVVNTMAGPLAELKSSLAEWQVASNNQPVGPTEEEMLELKNIATKIANSSMSLVSWDQIDILPMELADFAEEMPPWFDEMVAVLSKTSLQFLSWFQNMSNVAALKREAPGQCWLSPSHDFALTIEAAGRARLKRCLSMFNDGSLMLTADSRGSTYYVSGPHVHSFGVFKSTPLNDMLALHHARVQAHLAGRPGISIKPMDSLDNIEEFENLLRSHSREFRLANGMTDPEIRGMNVKFNDFFAIELKREVADRIAVLKATHP
ncbi:hypothetical protein ACO0LM_21940 [Undibacterium sp. Di26W]|uniref:hypothetical protein n=1 Tax=Undibacterium sp. Di26W TaxID=3413035 RepID=UPI003BF38FF2